MYDGHFVPLKKISLEQMARGLPTNRVSHTGYSILDRWYSVVQQTPRTYLSCLTKLYASWTCPRLPLPSTPVTRICPLSLSLIT